MVFKSQGKTCNRRKDAVEETVGEKRDTERKYSEGKRDTEVKREDKHIK